MADGTLNSAMALEARLLELAPLPMECLRPACHALAERVGLTVYGPFANKQGVRAYILSSPAAKGGKLVWLPKQRGSGSDGWDQ